MADLKGFALSNYRSFGDEPQFVAPLAKVNIIAGKNNTGKSNLLRYLRDLGTADFKAMQISTQSQSKFTGRPADARSRLTDGGPFPFTVGYPIEINEEALNGLKIRPPIHAKRLLTAIRQYWVERTGGDIWHLVNVEGERSQMPPAIEPYEEIALRLKADPDSQQLIQILNQRFSSDGRAQPRGDLGMMIARVHELCGEAARVDQWCGDVEFVDAIREIKPGGSDADDLFMGEGLVERLQQVLNPTTATAIHNEKLASRINRFVRTVVADESADLSVPHDASVLQVRLSRGLFDLSDLGTGIHEVVILAAAATITSNSLVCIEEPEIHLHPTLLRRLVNYLGSDATSNQYMITTHSGALINTPGASIFQATYDDGTRIRHISRAQDQYGAVADLGYRASDLIQANSIIWVEGPSDRIYLSWWLRLTAPDLLEGTEYSIMMYGGSLSSHLSADSDEQVDPNLVTLRRLNRNTALMADSDRQAPDDDLSSATTRLQTELLRDDSFSWITNCRTIENYLDKGILQAACGEVHRRSPQPPADAGQFSNPFGKLTKPRKSAIARKVVETSDITEVPDRWGLRQSVEDLAAWIRSAQTD